MSDPELYTLPQVLEIVRGHAGVLRAASAALGVSEGKDAVVLAVVGERALKASEELWAIDEAVGLRQPPWYSVGDRDIGDTLNALPLLVLAVEAAGTDPHGTLCPGERWTWCHDQVEHIAEELSAWVTEHEKGVGEPKENGAGAHPISQPEEPETAYDRAHEADDLIVAAIDRLAVLAIDMRPFDNVDHRDVFDHGEEDTEDGWPTLKLTAMGTRMLRRAAVSAVDAARASRNLQYKLRPGAPEGWSDATRRCLELTFALVPALETLTEWEDVDGGSSDFFSAGEIITELVEPVRDAHAALAAAYAKHSPFEAIEASP